MLTRDDIRSWLLRHGYAIDSYGNFKRAYISKDGKPCVARMKIRDRSVIREVKLDLPNRQWIKNRAAYFSGLSINENDQLVWEKKI